MNTVTRLLIALAVPLALGACAVVPAGPYGGPVVAPAPVVVTPSIGFGYYRSYGYLPGWGHGYRHGHSHGWGGHGRWH